MGDVAVRKHCYIYCAVFDDALQLIFFEDRDPTRVQGPGKFGWVATPGDIGDLGRGEAHYLELRVVTEYQVEVMEIPACGAKDKNVFHKEGHQPFPCMLR